VTTFRDRSRSHRQAARHARALRRAMNATTSAAVRREMLASLGR
jgi:hypothetical protein